MEKNSVKHEMREKKIFLFISIVVALSAIFILYFYISLHRFFNVPPRIFITDKITYDINSDLDFQKIASQATLGQGLPLPVDSINIFACNDKQRDPAYWLAFELPKDEIPSYVEKITGVKFTAYINGISSMYSFIHNGPKKTGGKYLAKEYWDLSKVINGYHYEKEFFYCGVDIDRNKIYLCRWSM